MDFFQKQAKNPYFNGLLTKPKAEKSNDSQAFRLTQDSLICNTSLCANYLL
jgi:hypothetical protein